MEDTIYVYSGPPGTSPPYANPFTVSGTWADWLRDAWIKALTSNGYATQAAPWTPTYEPATVSWPGNDGNVNTIPLDRFQVPTKETAEELARRYAVRGKPLVILDIPFIGPGWAFSKAIFRHLQWPNNATMPVSTLATFYSQNPENQSHAADGLCRALIARIWQG